MIYALTGGIGSGKSYVAKCIKDTLGLPIYDCDSEAKRLMVTSPEIHSKLTALIGAEVYLTDGTLNKKFLADYLFANKQHQKAVNEIVHPCVVADFEAWVKQHSGNIIVESAILFEAGLDKYVDKIIVIVVPLEKRIQRVMQRDGLTREQVQERINCQLSDYDMLFKADHLILNDGQAISPQIAFLKS